MRVLGILLAQYLMSFGKAKITDMKMNPVTFFTPSFIGDLERAIWLRRSISTFFADQAPHIISVPKRDIPAFRRHIDQQSDVQFIPQEEFVDPYYYPNLIYRITSKVLPSQLWRLGQYGGKRGWIIQQIVKLNCLHAINGGTVVFLDSDLFFFRRFSLCDLGIDDPQQRTLARSLPNTESAKHRQHLINSRLLLKAPSGSTEHTYMASPAIWYIDWLKQLHDHIELTSQRPWQRAIFDADFNISEYTIYGVFIDEILKPPQIKIRQEPYNLIAWDHPSFHDVKSRLMRPADMPKDKIGLVIQSNLGIETTEYEDLLLHLLNHNQD